MKNNLRYLLGINVYPCLIYRNSQRRLVESRLSDAEPDSCIILTRMNKAGKNKFGMQPNALCRKTGYIGS